MKTGLAAALAAAVLLLGSLVYWKTRPGEGSAPAGPVSAKVPESAPSPDLSVEPAGPASAVEAPKGEKEARSAAAPATIPPPALEGDLASASPKPADEVNPALPTSIDEAKGAGTEDFEKRYAGVSAENRRAAQESLRNLLYASQNGEFGKQQALTDEQIREFKREIEWLSEHEIP